MNRVFLIGLATTRPSRRGAECVVEVGVPQARGARQWLERVRIVARGSLAEEAAGLSPAQSVFASGRLGYRDGVAVVEVLTLFALDDPPPLGVDELPAAGTHASPRPHDRVGHPRRIFRGTPEERVVWVRPTRVRGS